MREEDLCAQLEERAADARDLDRELSRALDGVTTPNLQTLKELRERCRDFVGVKLEARRELDSLCDAAEQWAKEARRILTDPHAKKAPTKARRLLEQLTEIKCGVGPMGVTLQEQVTKADKWTEQALSVSRAVMTTTRRWVDSWTRRKMFLHQKSPDGL